MKLNQIIAVEKGTKNRVTEQLTDVYKKLQKPDFFNGHHKTYQPLNEDPSHKFSEKLPDDRREVQQHTKKLLNVVRESQSELWNLSLQRDITNCKAKSDVVVDGQTVLKDVPVTFLLFLEKQLNDLHSEVKKIPTLDPAERWSFDREQNLYATVPTEQARTKKETMPLVLHPGTKEHPPQVKEITEDVRAGTWKTIKYSSAMSVEDRDKTLSKVEQLQKAVKQAREHANLEDVPKDIPNVGKAIFDFVGI